MKIGEVVFDYSGFKFGLQQYVYIDCGQPTAETGRPAVITLVYKNSPLADNRQVLMVVMDNMYVSGIWSEAEQRRRSDKVHIYRPDLYGNVLRFTFDKTFLKRPYILFREFSNSDSLTKYLVEMYGFKHEEGKGRLKIVNI